MKIILHVPDALRIKNAISNAKNILKGMDSQIDIAMVFNADAVASVLKVRMPEDILNSKSINLILCNNSLIVNKVDISTVPDHFSIVPSSVIFIIEKQAEGFLYIRP